MNDGDTIRIGDLNLPEGVEAIDDPQTTLITITQMQAEASPLAETELEEDVAEE
jgi:hypothetical protein